MSDPGTIAEACRKAERWQLMAGGCLPQRQPCVFERTFSTAKQLRNLPHSRDRWWARRGKGYSERPKLLIKVWTLLPSSFFRTNLDTLTTHELQSQESLGQLENLRGYLPVRRKTALSS
ncbi:hypothetical protein KCU95_g105, partial [Aureobasidium melanogenum]